MSALALLLAASVVGGERQRVATARPEPPPPCSAYTKDGEVCTWSPGDGNAYIQLWPSSGGDQILPAFIFVGHKPFEFRGVRVIVQFWGADGPACEDTHEWNGTFDLRGYCTPEDTP